MNHVKAFFLSPAKSYISEGRDLLPCRRTSDPEFESTLPAAAVSADVVLFVKHGCGHCQRAEKRTEHFSSRRLIFMDSAAKRSALARALGLPALTVPVVFVRGRCIGDGEALAALLPATFKGYSGGPPGAPSVYPSGNPSGGPTPLTPPSPGSPVFPTERSTSYSSSAMDAALALPVAADPFARGVPDLRAWTERRLCKPPGAQGLRSSSSSSPARLRALSAYFFNTYGNTVRVLSLGHLVVFGLALALLPLGTMRYVALVLALDLVLFCASGNLSPMALAATALIWTRRGPVVPAIPYKAVFVSYILTLLGLAAEKERARVRAALIACIVNSAMLAVLRF